MTSPILVLCRNFFPLNFFFCLHILKFQKNCLCEGFILPSILLGIVWSFVHPPKIWRFSYKGYRLAPGGTLVTSRRVRVCLSCPLACFLSFCFNTVSCRNSSAWFPACWFFQNLKCSFCQRKHHSLPLGCFQQINPLFPEAPIYIFNISDGYLLIICVSSVLVITYQVKEFALLPPGSWDPVSACLRLQSGGQWFALRAPFPYGSKKRCWFFSLFSLFLVRTEWWLQGPSMQNWKSGVPTAFVFS